MLGINNDKIEFSDIKIGSIRPPKDAAGGAGGANGAGGEDGEASSGIKAADDEEVEEMSLEEDEEAALNSEDKSRMCASQTTCAAHAAWCAETYKDEVPGDCVDKFMDYCCGTLAPNNLEECKLMVDEAFTPVEPDDTVSLECFDQTVVNGDKNKYDQCVSCCGNKIDRC